MKHGLLELLTAISGVISISEWLESSAYDERIEIDLNKDVYRIITFVMGKNDHAATEGRFTDLCEFTVERLVHPDDAGPYSRFVDAPTLSRRLENASPPGVLVGEFRFKMKDGPWRWVEVCIVGGTKLGFEEGIARLYTYDIQVQKNRLQGEYAPASLEGLLRNDKTGLLWERSFFTMAERRLAEVDACSWCIIAIDIDHFSLFNDWYGRETGDLLLSRLGEELTVAEERSTGVAGYLGQDDFCLLAPYDTERMMNLYERLGGIITELTSATGFKPIFGVCVADGATPILDLFDRAKLAHDHARADFKADICMYEPAMYERDEAEYRILLDFQQGLEENEFIIYLQPQCRISSGKLIGAEALVRWAKPDGTIVPPDAFIPVLERHGFVTDLDCYVWEHVCSNLRNWIDTGHVPIPVSVNVSQDDFYSIDVADYFKQLVEQYNIPPSLIKVEITESALGDENDSETVVEAVKELRAAGFMVLLDDFGSGYSSLNKLGNLNVDIIKLDAGFFRVEEKDKRKGIRIVESIINMTKTMGTPIICEGVETQEQIDFLESLGCRYVQGFYFYRPMPVSEFEQLIGDGTEIDELGFVMKQNEQLRLREFLDQNIYSDAMLNSILGPVAIYLWHGDDIDIIRFNEQFYEAVGVPDFNERLTGIQRFVPASEVHKLFDLVERATVDSLNGASDIVGFFRTDGSLSRFMIRMYYLGENDEGKRFYGSARDVTEITELQTELQLLSERLETSIVFMRWQNGSWHFKSIIHGLSDELGVSQEQFQAELDNGKFLSRINREDFENVHRAARQAVKQVADFFNIIRVERDDGTYVRLRLEADRVKDASGAASYIVKLNVV